jgi:SNF2 family DNA or RNA helicase
MTCAMRTNQDWGVVTAPLPHQLAALEKMKPTRVGALFMDMGTGKSLVVILLAHLRRHKISKVVWCCPVSLKRNTCEQILMHTDCAPGQVYLFNDKTTDKNMPLADWYIVGLESIGGSNRVTVAFNALIDEHTMLIVDESSYIKGHRAKRTKRLTLIGLRAKYRLVLNGTPISQGLEDLYAQISFLSERILGYRSWYSFSRAHLSYSEKFKGKIERRDGLGWIGERIAPYVYQVKKSECLTLPKKGFANRYVNLTGAQQKLFDAAKIRFEDEVMQMDSEDEIGILIYRLFGALQAIVNGVIPAGFHNEGGSLSNRKIDEVIATLDRINEPHTVVWARYRRSVLDLQSSLIEEGYQPWLYYGDLSEAKRAEQLEGWRNEGGVLVATESCGGFGLTLTEASYCIFMGNGFKYSERIQAEDRLHRIGQSRNVHYTSIWARAGIEERIEAALDKKENALHAFRREVDRVKRGGKDKLKELLKAL